MSKPACVHGVIAVIERHGELLMIRRADGIAAPGWWCFPGGAIEPGEPPAVAVARETLEEVGLVVHPVRQVWEWARPDGKLVLFWWLARLERPEQAITVNPAEVAEARWLPPAAIRELQPLLPNNLEFLDIYECLQSGSR